ncbi:hypothetical protein IWX49DRAFT_430264 [Phyllosticta citricarpa]
MQSTCWATFVFSLLLDPLGHASQRGHVKERKGERGYAHHQRPILFLTIERKRLGAAAQCSVLARTSRQRVGYLVRKPEPKGPRPRKWRSAPQLGDSESCQVLWC